MNHKELEKVLKALANRRRIAILKCLKHLNKASVGVVASEIKLSFRATSRHLSVLFSADILEKEQSGLMVLYFISKDKNPIVSKLLSII
ncbi:ArsR family transcriptional regulator [Candidatus Nomurabacteria bacterium]|nr:ArsR family transcriptional regulator [Candidatus Nomurabacteria bacterium]